MGNGRGRRVYDDLSDGLGSEGAGGLIAAFKFYPQPSHIQPGGDLILHERVVHHMTLFVVLDILI